MKLLLQMVLMITLLIAVLNAVNAGTVEEICYKDAETSSLEYDSVKRNVVIDFEFNSGSYNLQNWFPRYFQLLVKNSQKVNVLVSEQDFRRIDNIQRLWGQCDAKPVDGPTDYYVVTVKQSVNKTDLGLDVKEVFGSGIGVRIDDYTRVQIELFVQPYDIKTRSLQPGWNVSGSASGPTGALLSSGGSFWGGGQRAFFDRGSIDKSLEGKAAKDAAANFLKKYKPAPLKKEYRGSAYQIGSEVSVSYEAESCGQYYFKVAGMIIKFSVDNPLNKKLVFKRGERIVAEYYFDDVKSTGEIISKGHTIWENPRKGDKPSVVDK